MMTIDDILSTLPTLETGRLLLWEASAEEFARFIGTLPRDERPEQQHGASAGNEYPTSIDQFGVHHLPCWSVVCKETDEIIGCCALAGWQLRHSRAELSFATAPPHRGKGYMTEALRTVIGFGFRVMELNRIEALCRPDQEAALAMMRKLGLREEMLLREYRPRSACRGDRKLFSLLRNEWDRR